MSIAVVSVGLLAFGHLNVAEDILTALAIPLIYNGAKVRRTLANSLKALLPLPPELALLREPATIQAWLQAHADHLVWDEATGKFVFDEAAAS
jgi:hypothetical protein